MFVTNQVLVRFRLHDVPSISVSASSISARSARRYANKVFLIVDNLRAHHAKQVSSGWTSGKFSIDPVCGMSDAFDFRINRPDTINAFSTLQQTPPQLVSLRGNRIDRTSEAYVKNIEDQVAEGVANFNMNAETEVIEPEHRGAS